LHLHAHTVNLESRQGEIDHGVFDIPQRMLSHYGNMTTCLLSLADHMLLLADQGQASRREERGDLEMPLPLEVVEGHVFEGRSSQSVGYIKESSGTGQGQRTIFLTHVRAVFHPHWTYPNLRVLVSIYPIRDVA
jgi:hypothetical protein